MQKKRCAVKRVLVVDDMEEFINELTKLFSLWGWEMKRVKKPDDFRDILDTGLKFSLLLSDIDLSGGSINREWLREAGIDLIKEFRLRMTDSPIFAYSARDTAVQEKVIQAGVTHFIKRDHIIGFVKDLLEDDSDKYKIPDVSATNVNYENACQTLSTMSRLAMEFHFLKEGMDCGYEAELLESIIKNRWEKNFKAGVKIVINDLMRNESFHSNELKAEVISFTEQVSKFQISFSYEGFNQIHEYWEGLRLMAVHKLFGLSYVILKD
jgi:CheY-like chemotaxis protein